MHYIKEHNEVLVEHPKANQPHQGKVLAAVQSHADDIPFFCAGTIAKLLNEGYTGYLIQTTNDEKCGPTSSIGETILNNEREVDQLAQILGLKQVFNLGYRNHRQDGDAILELRCRLIFLFRYLKVDTVFTFNPWGHNEENPDHYITAQAVESAAWMAGMAKDYPEQVAAGIAPHSVKDKYYWAMRPGQPYNRVVDIGPYIDTKVASMSVNKSQGPAGAHGSNLKKSLAAQGLQLPALSAQGDDPESADRAFIRLFGLGEYKEWGKAHNLEYSEIFYYMPPGGTFTGITDPKEIEHYIANNAIPLK